MVSLRKKPKDSIIGEVPVTSRNGRVITVARVEKLRSGGEVFHINLSNHTPDILLRGFSMGDLPQ